MCRSSVNTRRAIEIYRQLLDAVLAGKPKPATVLSHALHLSNIWAAKAALHRRLGQKELASALETKRRELWLHWDRLLPHNGFVQRHLEESRLP
jgi:hypothetical protein